MKVWLIIFDLREVIKCLFGGEKKYIDDINVYVNDMFDKDDICKYIFIIFLIMWIDKFLFLFIIWIFYVWFFFVDEGVEIFEKEKLSIE